MKYIFLVLFSSFCLSTQAQQSPIMRCNPSGTVCTPHYTLDDAVNSASPGEFIYLPGGTFTLGVIINKSLNIIGAGMNPDSSLATGITIINSDLNISQAASQSFFEGLKIIGNVTTPDMILSCTFSRCSWNQFNWAAGATPNPQGVIIQYSEIVNCYIYNMNSGLGCMISNCILDFASDMSQSTFQNCDFLYHPGHQWANCHNTNFISCIFGSIYGHPIQGGSNVFSSYNVLLAGTEPGYLHSDSLVSSCLNIYANATCPTAYLPTSETAFQLNPAVPLGFGNSPRGIFGGSDPWKMGAVPSNPHIYFKQIPQYTNTNGQLPVNIKVRSEN